MAHPITRNCFLSTNKSNFLKIQCKKDSIKTQLKKQCAKQLSDRIRKSELRATIRANKQSLLALLKERHTQATKRPPGLSQALLMASLELDRQQALILHKGQSP